MKFKKLITSSVVAASLFGVFLGGSSLNAKAADSARDASIKSPNQIIPSQGYNQDTHNIQGQNSGKTNSNIEVDNGLLNLDNVPSLNFGNKDVSQYSTNLGLQNNKDDNQSNMLQVTDNRNPSNDNGSWTVSASLGQVYKTDETNNGGQRVPSSDTDWAINLNSTNVQNDENHSFNTTSQTFGTNGNTNAGMKPIMSTSKDSNQGQGVNTIQYNNNSSDANLTIPYNVKRGTYSADVTWNLSVSANASTANSGSSQNQNSTGQGKSDHS